MDGVSLALKRVKNEFESGMRRKTVDLESNPSIFLDQTITYSH